MVGEASIPFAALIEPIARELLGEPNRSLSSKTELRYGSRGSLSVDLKKGTWFDHETSEGGGALDLVERQTGLREGERLDWVEQHTNWRREDGHRKPNGRGELGPIIETYDYTDEGGEFLFQVTRHDPPKDFRQRRKPRAGDLPSTIHDGWVWSVKGCRLVPYRLPDLIEALANDSIVFIVEGEKDVNNLWRVGVPGTTNPMGAGKWRAELNQHFADADVVVIPDNDPQKKNPRTGELMNHPDGRPILPGQDHAIEICKQLKHIARRVRYLDLSRDWPTMPLKGDVSDWLREVGSVEKLYALVDDLPDWSLEIIVRVPGAPIIYPKLGFIMNFIPPDYLIDGIAQRRFIYSLTGQTGHAKTAVALLIAMLVSSSEQTSYLANHRVEKGRVIYFVGENPDDVRMRVIGMDARRKDNPDLDNISFVPGIFNIDDIISVINMDIKKNGDVSLVIVDTSAAYFLGKEELSNTEMGSYARTLRRLTTLQGGPCVIVLCHPIKHVMEQYQLLPRGGGAYLAEMDGNLTLWRRSDEVIELHHAGKFRGADFLPVWFKLETIKDAPKLKDAKGRQINTVQAVVMTQQEAEGQNTKVRSEQDRVLCAMLANPEGSLREWAEQIGWCYDDGSANHKKIDRILTGLLNAKGAKLVRQERGGHWALTDAGKDEARPIALEQHQRAHPQQQRLGFDENA